MTSQQIERFISVPHPSLSCEEGMKEGSSQLDRVVAVTMRSFVDSTPLQMRLEFFLKGLLKFQSIRQQTTIISSRLKLVISIGHLAKHGRNAVVSSYQTERILSK